MNRQRKGWKLGFLLTARSGIAIAGAGFLALLVFAALYHREPTYGGRTASSWLRRSAEFGNSFQNKEINEAFRKLGSKAVPIEIKALSRKDSQFDKWCRDTYPKLPFWLRRVLREPLHPDRLRLAALQALELNEHTGEHLGEVLALVRHDDAHVRHMAASLLQILFRPEDTLILSSVVEALHNPDAIVRSYIASSLGKCTSGDSASIALPPLHKALKDDSVQVRIFAANSLATIDTNSVPLAVRVLREAMTDSELENRVNAAMTVLQKFDSGSEEAVRVLIAALGGRQSVSFNPSPGLSASAEGMPSPAEDLMLSSARRNTNVISILTEMASGDSDAKIQKASRRLLDRISSEKARLLEGSQLSPTE